MIYTHIPKSKPKKLNAAQRQLRQEWTDIVDKYKTVTKPVQPISKIQPTPFRRQTQEFPSLNSGHHDTSAKPSAVYTGTKILGIGTLHKSNAVPVFSEEEAIDISKMRRG
jgi:hypothetical protein